MDIKEFKQLRELLTIQSGYAASVIVDGDLSFALRKFKRIMKNNERLTEVYDRSSYTKPSVKKRLTNSNAAYAQKMRTAEENAWRK